MTEKIAALAFVFVFALLLPIVVLGLLTAYRDRSNGLSAGCRATKRESPARTTPHTNFPLSKIISVASCLSATCAKVPRELHSKEGNRSRVAGRLDER